MSEKFITMSEVAKVSPKCAAKMREAGLDRIRVAAGAPSRMRMDIEKHLKKEMRSNPDMFDDEDDALDWYIDQVMFHDDAPQDEDGEEDTEKVRDWAQELMKKQSRQYENGYKKALAQAVQMMEAEEGLEPRSALKQAGSDNGIPYGPEMAKFVKWAEGKLSRSASSKKVASATHCLDDEIRSHVVAKVKKAGGIKRWLEDISVEMGLDGEITKAVMKEAEKRMKKIKVKKGTAAK